jgi:V/A-type H+-transporting ATPase subunit A
MREIGSLLGEMPGEEGYPTSLSTRLAHLYERAGRVRAMGEPERQGAVTFISALSPPSGDFSEPVTQASLRVVSALWGLDARLARQRQFPAIDWEVSYSLDVESVMPWLHEEVGASWAEVRQNILGMLQRDRELREIVGLVGLQALDEKDRLVLESARLLRTHFLGQSAIDPSDAFSPLAKTFAIASLIDEFHRAAAAAVEAGRQVSSMNLPAVFAAVADLRSAAIGDLDAQATRARALIRAAMGGNR